MTTAVIAEQSKSGKVTMSKITIRSESTIEKHEMIVVRFRRRFVRVWCTKCLRDVGMIAPFDAAILLNYELQKVRQLMQKGQVHLGFNEQEEAFICLRSLYVNEEEEWSASS